MSALMYHPKQYNNPMNSGRWIVLCCSVLLLFVFSSNIAFAGNCLPEGAPEKVRIDYVVDGDTVYLADERKVRLVGINTPELARPEKYATEEWQRHDQLLAGEARDRLRSLLVGEVLLYPSIAGRDSYKRVLGYLVVNGGNVTELMLGQGLGFAVAVAPDVTLAECYARKEREARMKNLGVWQLYPPVAAATFSEKVGHGGFALMSGLVTRVSSSKHRIWMNIDDSVAVMVSRKWLDLFPQPLESFEGQFVEVRGWVIDRLNNKYKRLPPYVKRWQVAVSHPTMISMVSL